jgi:small subunit ribosomal protein S1
MLSQTKSASGGVKKETEKEEKVKKTPVKKAEVVKEEKPKTASKDADQKSEDAPKAKKEKLSEFAQMMEELGDEVFPLKVGELKEVSVLAVTRNKIWVDVAGISLGFIPEKEMSDVSEVKVGDKILAYVISLENDEGNVILSLKRADRERYWFELEKKLKDNEALTIKITEANKGGLIAEYAGIQGFLPVSQLSAEHYPRVQGGDREEILGRLNSLIGEILSVKVITCERDTGKLIFSEKSAQETETKSKLQEMKIGQKVTGKITGIVDFGLFVSIGEGIEGLVHISELSWGRVTDIAKLYKVGQPVEVLVIANDGSKISLSIKRLLPDPWAESVKHLKVGQELEGEVTKITPFGAFVSLGQDIDGLVHISELSSEHVVDPGKIVKLGEKYKFRIISIEPESHRLGLSLKKADEVVAPEK